MKQINIGEKIKYDWYELQCQLSKKTTCKFFSKV